MVGRGRNDLVDVEGSARQRKPSGIGWIGSAGKQQFR